MIVPSSRDRGIGYDQAKLESENCIEHIIHLDHDIADLFRRLLGVHHNLRFIANVYH
jgi:hypothetical protein